MVARLVALTACVAVVAIGWPLYLAVTVAIGAAIVLIVPYALAVLASLE